MVGRMSRWMGQYHDEWHAHLLSQQNPLTDNLSLWWAGWGSLRCWGPAMVYSVHGRWSRLLDLHIKKWSWSARRWRRRRPQFNIPYSFVVIAVHCRRYCSRHLHRLTVNPNSLRICHSAWMQTVFVIRHSAFAIRFLLFDIAKFYLIHNLLAVFTSVSFRFISSGYHQHHHTSISCSCIVDSLTNIKNNEWLLARELKSGSVTRIFHEGGGGRNDYNAGMHLGPPFVILSGSQSCLKRRRSFYASLGLCPCGTTRPTPKT